MNEEKLKDYINEKIEEYVENTTCPLDNIPKTNYYCGYIKALEDLKDFLEIKEEE